MNALSSRRILVLAAGLLAAGCSGAAQPKADAINNVARGDGASQPAAATTNQAELPVRVRLDEEPIAADAPAEKADPAIPTRAWFAGKWSDTGDCAEAGTFEPNGTYLLADGTRGMWSVQDGKLFVQHAGGRATVRLRKIDDRTVEIVNEGGTAGRSIRC